MRILFVADLVGRPGRRVARALLPPLREESKADLVIANGENLAGGHGVTHATVSELLKLGVDVITSGNHVWDRRDGLALLESEPRLLRPANYPRSNPGRGSRLLELGPTSVAVVNLQGRVFMPAIDDPFQIGCALIDELRATTNIIVIDFHAEATAEKLAFARHVDGLASAVVGTHTHVPTADAQILPGGTAYITDLGMTGSHGGVIGFKAEQAIQRAILGRRVRLEPADGDLRLQGAIVDVDPETGRATGIEQIDRVMERSAEGG